MIIDCIADLHGYYPKLDGGDLLIVAGDLTARDSAIQLYDFMDWIMNDCCYKKRIVIGGNHDNILQSNERFMIHDVKNEQRIEYLCDSGTEFEYEVEVPHPASTEHVIIDVLCYERRKLKIWGSPWTKTFPGMNPKCKAFTVDTEEGLAEKWALIPDDVDILVTHCPPFGVMDDVYNNTTGEFDNTGSGSLSIAIMNRPSIKLAIFGHIHESYGKKDAGKEGHRIFVNASHVNERYEPVNKPIRVIL